MKPQQIENSGLPKLRADNQDRAVEQILAQQGSFFS
jgi:hypothetical protein